VLLFVWGRFVLSLYLERSKARLKKEINKEITSFFEKCLDFVEVTLPEEKIYKVVRSKILRSGNNAIREVNKNIDINYTINYSPEDGLNEDVIELKRM
jgi:hypothetical protein